MSGDGRLFCAFPSTKQCPVYL